MTLQRLIESTRAPQHVWVRRCLYALLAINLWDNVPVWVDKSQAHTGLEHVPTFWSVFGFLGCILLIILSKAFGHAGIMKREDYYDE
ncbi:MAG: hypothetical protein IPM17_17950 [Verrucomicrobia bacterium]|jgi:hypothetical protein|nr:hypothetical protein [Verrucomicrobiota bacterium]